MRPLAKVVLLLALVVMAVGVLFLASRDWSDLDKYNSLGADSIKRLSDRRTTYNDPVAMYERWRKRLTQRDTGGTDDAAGPAPARETAAPAPSGRDLLSTSRDEGTVVAGGGDAPVAGADPPGPVLRPADIIGDIVTGRIRPKRAESQDVHVVVQGDTLYGISVARYGSADFVDEIMAANPAIDPGALKVGDRIVLPRPPSKKAATPQPRRTKVYVVKKGDTLIGIARSVYGDAAMYPKIYKANKDVLSSLNARLYIGMRLRLPEPK